MFESFTVAYSDNIGVTLRVGGGQLGTSCSII